MSPLSLNSWFYLFILLGAGFLYSVPIVRRHRWFFFFLLNIIFYFLVAPQLLPALFYFSSLTYLFCMLAREKKFSWLPVTAIATFVLSTIALFVVWKLSLEFRPGRQSTWTFLVPVGFSYIALQNIAFVLHAREQRPEDGPGLLEFFVGSMFFANITSGPITDIRQIIRDIHGGVVTSEDVQFGFVRIINGFFKKAISDVFSAVLLEEGPLGGARLYFVPLLLLKFYMDFSGYTDMAIGGARLLGVSLPENFNKPYSSVTISDYWNRWHMTLGGWFKTHFFYPLQIFIFRSLRLSETLQVVAVNAVLFLTFVGIGLWHGINTKFFLWGLLNATFVLLSNKTIRLKTKLGGAVGFWIFNWLTLFLIFVGQVLLLSPGVWAFLENMRTTFSPQMNGYVSLLTTAVISVVLFLQHFLDGKLQDGIWRNRKVYVLLISLQIIIVLFIHKSGGGFLYANF